MNERQSLMQNGTLGSVPALTYPIVFGDGEFFPDDAKATQQTLDLKRFAYPYRQFRDTALYLEFDDTVRRIAEELTRRLVMLPPWCPTWPTLSPDPEPQPLPVFPRI